MRSVQTILVVFGVVIGSSIGGLDVAAAQTASVGVEGSSNARIGGDVFDDFSEGGLSMERTFVDVQAGLWVPGPWTFNLAHTVSLQFGAEVGFRVATIAQRHHLYAVGALMISPQTLEESIGADASTIVMPSGGVRYINNAMCTRDGNGCSFAELGIGMAFELTDDGRNNDPSFHHAPYAAWTINLGFGYRHRITRNAQIGARIDIVYLDDRRTHELAWITPSLFGGMSF